MNLSQEDLIGLIILAVILFLIIYFGPKWLRSWREYKDGIPADVINPYSYPNDHFDDPTKKATLIDRDGRPTPAGPVNVDPTDYKTIDHIPSTLDAGAFNMNIPGDVNEGDTVQCIDAQENGKLKEGKTYILGKVNDMGNFKVYDPDITAINAPGGFVGFYGRNRFQRI